MNRSQKNKIKRQIVQLKICVEYLTHSFQYIQGSGVEEYVGRARNKIEDVIEHLDELQSQDPKVQRKIGLGK